jgi:hypothetical protein
MLKKPVLTPLSCPLGKLAKALVLPVLKKPELRPLNVPPLAVLKKPELRPLNVPPLAALKKPELMSPVFPKPELVQSSRNYNSHMKFRLNHARKHQWKV